MVATVRYDSKAVKVHQGLERNWRRAFPEASIRIPEGWETSIEVDNRMVRFAFVTLKGGQKVPDGSYVAVIWCGTRDQALGKDFLIGRGACSCPECKDIEAEHDARTAWTETTYILPVMAALRPQQEDAGPRLSPLQFLEASKVASWTKDQMENLIRAKKVRVS